MPWKSGVRASATGSYTISAIVGPFHRKWRHQTSPDPLGATLGRVVCTHAEPEAVQYPIKRFPKGFRWKIWEHACTIASAICVLSRTSGSYNLIIFYELALSLVICPFPAILFSLGAPSIIAQPFFWCFRMCSWCCVVLQGGFLSRPLFPIRQHKKNMMNELKLYHYSTRISSIFFHYSTYFS